MGVGEPAVTDAPDRAAAIDQLLDRSVAALNRGDVTTAHDLAEQVLAADVANRDAVALLGVGGPSLGELRRLSLLFCDLVGSTELSGRHEPETYRTLIGHYKAVCREVVEQRYGGHISHIAGDGMLAVFGLPTPHENDAERATRAGLDIVRDLRRLSDHVETAVGERLEARAAVHRGLVYLDVHEDEVYGLAANVAARLQSLAAPGTVVMSAEVRQLVGAFFETVPEKAQRAKGVDEPLQPFRVVAERPETAARGWRWAAPLADRKDELARLRQLWRQARNGTGGRPRAVHLVGEAGIGKSRLAAVLGGEAVAESAACVQLLGSPFHVDATLYPLRVFIERHCGLDRDALPAERLARLEHEIGSVGLPPGELVPLLAPVLDIPPEAGYGVTLEGRKLHEAIVAAAVRYLLATLGPGPALLIAEDLHWCDDATVDVLARALGAGRGDLLVVTTSREGPPPVLGRVHLIELTPLDATAARELVRSLDPDLDEHACSALVDRGDGMPLFLEELVRGIGAPVNRVADPTGSVPEALYEPLVTRLYATGAGVPVAAAAATIGRDIDHQVLAQVVDVSEADLESVLEALLGGLILERVLGRDRCYRFRHELLRSVAYELQPESERRGLHGRVADALVSEGAGVGAVDWRLVASHYDVAENAAEAIHAYANAADGARRLGALGEARSHLTRAIELVASLSDSTGRRSQEVGLRLRRGFLAASAEGNSSPDVVQDYERCLELGLADIGGDDMFSTLIALYGHYMVRGDLGRAHQVAEMLRSGLAAGREYYRPDNDGAFGTIHWCAGDFDAARDRLEAAVAGLDTRVVSPDYAATYFMAFDGPAAANGGLALARFMQGDVRGSDAQIDAALTRCQTLEFPQGPFTTAFTRYYASWLLIERGDLVAAAAATAAMGEIGELHGFDLWALVAATQQATIDGLLVLATEPLDVDTLTAHAQTVEGMVATWRMLDIALLLPFVMATGGRLRAASGERDAAAAHYDEALQFSATTGMHWYDAEVLRLRAQLLADDEARSALRAALDLARAQRAVPFELRIARDLMERGDVHGMALVDEATARFAPDASYPELDEARALAASAR